MSFRLSPSSISLLQECPRCFWLNQHKVWHRPVGIFSSLPNGMDRILKKHFDRFMEIGELPPELCENDHCEDMKLFDDKEALEIWRNNLKGISHEDNEGNILCGAVDNLLVKGKKLIVLDYKTRGYALKDNTHKHYQNQLDIYNFLLRKNNFETEDCAFLLFYIPREVLQTGEVVFDTTLVKMNISVNNAERLWNNALKLLNGECPSQSCQWCERF